MRVLLRLVGVAVAVAATPVRAAPSDTPFFRDWVVGCDNVRSCTAVAENDAASLRITRAGGREAEPAIAVVLYADAGSDARDGAFRLAFDDPAVPGLPTDPLAAQRVGNELRAKLDGAAARAAIEGFRRAGVLHIAGEDGSGKKTAADVSLDGVVAALRYIDGRQKRADTVTALIAKGEKPAAAVPASPELPLIRAQPIETAKSATPPPALPRAPKDCVESAAPPFALRLGASIILWGVCAVQGMRDTWYDFYVVGDGRPTPVLFERPPGVKATNRLVNPGVADGLIAEGEGDHGCGRRSSWAWDGAGFRLVAYAGMENCEANPGLVDPDNFPVLYRRVRTR